MILLGNSNDVLPLTAEQILRRLRKINNSGLNDVLDVCDKMRATKKQRKKCFKQLSCTKH